MLDGIRGAAMFQNWGVHPPSPFVPLPPSFPYPEDSSVEAKKQTSGECMATARTMLKSFIDDDTNFYTK